VLTVYKYPVAGPNFFSLNLPLGAKILTAQVQNGELQLWALVNSKNKTETRLFLLVGTGQSIRESEGELCYIGTFQLEGGAIVYHLFETARI